MADVVYQAIVDGVRHLDCACDYGNEVEVGHGIKRAIEAGVVRREDLWVRSPTLSFFHQIRSLPSFGIHIMQKSMSNLPAKSL